MGLKDFKLFSAVCAVTTWPAQFASYAYGSRSERGVVKGGKRPEEAGKRNVEGKREGREGKGEGIRMYL